MTSRNVREGRYIGWCDQHVRSRLAMKVSAYEAYILRAERDNYLPPTPRRYYMSKASVERLHQRMLAALARVERSDMNG